MPLHLRLTPIPQLPRQPLLLRMPKAPTIHLPHRHIVLPTHHPRHRGRPQLIPRSHLHIHKHRRLGHHLQRMPHDRIRLLLARIQLGLDDARMHRRRRQLRIPPRQLPCEQDVGELGLPVPSPRPVPGELVLGVDDAGEGRHVVA